MREQQRVDHFMNEIPIACTYQEMIFDEDGKAYDYEILYVNKAFEDMYQLRAVEIINKTFKQMDKIDLKKAENWMNHCIQVVSSKIPYDQEIYDERIQKWTLLKIIPGNNSGFLVISNEIKNETLKSYLIKDFFDANLDLMCIIDMQGKFLKVNQEFEHVLGYSVKELEGKSFIPLVHKEDLEVTLEAIKGLKEQKPINNVVNRYQCKSGSYVYIEWKAHPHGDLAYCSGRDITLARKMDQEINGKNEQLKQLIEDLKEANMKLECLVGIDALTGLNNRHSFELKCIYEIERSERYKTPLSMIMYDIDHFKCVNDNFGHPIGDEVLKNQSSLLKKIIRNTDLSFRIGGEEFVVILPSTTIENAMITAEKIRVTFEKSINPVVGKVTASFGVVQKLEFESFTDWYKRADEALYTAKRKGRNQVISYNDGETLSANIKIPWKKEWTSGNAIIDEHHKEILLIAQELFYSSYSTTSSDQILQEIDNLLENIKSHFEEEEHIMNELDFSGLKKHKEIHKQLISKSYQRKIDYIAGTIKPTAFLTFVLDEVVVNHLATEDVKFFPLIKQ